MSFSYLLCCISALLSNCCGTDLQKIFCQCRYFKQRTGSQFEAPNHGLSRIVGTGAIKALAKIQAFYTHPSEAGLQKDHSELLCFLKIESEQSLCTNLSPPPERISRAGFRVGVGDSALLNEINLHQILTGP